MPGCAGEASSNDRNSGEEFTMMDYAAMFLFFGVVAGGLHWAGVATVATQSSWVLLVSGIVLLVIHGMTRRIIPAP